MQLSVEHNSTDTGSLKAPLKHGTANIASEPIVPDDGWCRVSAKSYSLQAVEL